MSGPPPGVQLSPAQIAAFKEAGVRNTFIADLSAGFGPFIMGYVSRFLFFIPEPCPIPSPTFILGPDPCIWMNCSWSTRYCFNLMLLGVLIAQVWHWYSWIDRERKFIKIIVVRPLYSSITWSSKSRGRGLMVDDSTGFYSGRSPRALL